MDRAYVRAIPFLSAEQQIERLLAYGSPAERLMYVEGRGPEGMPALAKAARKDEIIGTVGGYVILGDNRSEIMAAVRALKHKRAIIFDIETGERSDRDGDIMLDRALRRIHGETTLGSPTRAAELGALGGKARWRGLLEDAIPRTHARRLWFDMSISRDEAARRAGPGWSKETMKREFGPSGRRKGPTRPKG